VFRKKEPSACSERKSLQRVQKKAFSVFRKNRTPGGRRENWEELLGPCLMVTLSLGY
jgi:hypothetical protein